VVTEIVLKVLRIMAGMMQQPVIGRNSHAVLESSWVGSGEPTVSKRRCPVLRRGTTSPRSRPIALRSFAAPINQPGTRRNPASAHWRPLPWKSYDRSSPIPSLPQCQNGSYNRNCREMTYIKAVGARDCRHNSTITSTMKSSAHSDSLPKKQR
jgi:hypothetical protein